MSKTFAVSHLCEKGSTGTSLAWKPSQGKRTVSIAALAHTPALPLCARTQGRKREQHDQPREAPREALVRGPGSFSAG